MCTQCRVVSSDMGFEEYLTCFCFEGFRQVDVHVFELLHNCKSKIKKMSLLQKWYKY